MSEPNRDVPMVPKHQSEMEKMHLTHMNTTMYRLCIIVAILFTIAIVATAWSNVEMSRSTVSLSKTFVDNYTARTEKWLETFLRVQTGHATEVLNEKEKTGYIQQPEIP